MRKHISYNFMGVYPFRPCTQALSQRTVDCCPQILSMFMSLIIEQREHSGCGYDT